MKCVINAIESNPSHDEPLALTPLHGVNLLERTLLNATHAGLTDFILLSVSEDVVVRQFADGLAQEHDLHIEHVVSEKNETDGQLLLSCHAKLKSQFVYLSVFYQFDWHTLVALLKFKQGQDAITLVVDNNTIHKKLNLVNVARVQCDNGKVHAMRLGLSEFNGFMTGLMLCSATLLNTLAAKQKQKAKLTVELGIQTLIEDDKVGFMPIDKAFWQVIDSFDTLGQAEHNLIMSLKHNPKDNPLKRNVLRPLSTALSSLLINTKLPVKFLALISLVVSILAALLFSTGGYGGLFFGAILAGFVTVMQIAIQEVAWLRLEQRKPIKWFGNVLAKYSEMILLAGLTLHLVHSDSKSLILIGLFAVIGSMMFHYSINTYQHIRNSEPVKVDDVMVKRDIRFAIIAIGAVLNLPTLVLLIMAILFNAIVIRRLFVWK